MPSSTAYSSRFKGLIRAYKLIGYTPEQDYEYIKINKYLRQMYPEVISDVIRKIEELGGFVERDEKTDLLLINKEFTTSLILARCRQTSSGSLRWFVRFDSGLEPDITIVLRMEVTNRSPMDYYLLPYIDMNLDKLQLAEENRLNLDAYRFDDLDFFFGMAEQVSIRMAI